MTVFEAARQVNCIQAAESLGLQLKRSGGRRFTRCLFHAENTPSMCLYPDGGGFYCFGCDEHGDVIRLYQQALSISPLDAAKRICSDFGLSYDQRKHKKQAPPPYKPPTLNVQTFAKKLTDWWEEQVQRLLCTKRTAEAQMEQIESRCVKVGMAISDALEEPEWETAFQQKCMVQERILNWCIEGLQLLDIEGFDEPEIVRQTTKDYAHNSDKMALFMEECLLEESGAMCRTSLLYATYSRWCEENGFHAENVRNFRSLLAGYGQVDRRCPSPREEKTTVILGCRLRDHR